MTKGLAFQFHNGPIGFLDHLSQVIDDLDDTDIELLEHICNWSWTNDCVIPAGELAMSPQEVALRLNKLEDLELIDLGVRVQA
ncbi:MAG: hypothetical protein LKH74_01640 [Levilactobacillus sp.]|jgi:RIO-like serine/threonine protein kinase|uniref:AsnC family protein n=1 Tax=Levilactobacillus suantsaiihabitans TaxID=2487722 RepID=A0A4Z0JAN3_9LACO|nr:MULTISPECIES: AsnC family protein [Levilactobacillus]MCH4123250.1 hypothetical protein [Levilactobacillus sp.]MCI1552612.1 hypothetical protein [Levilactobacillus sp.]MCI1599357.1 hypothetical protein [Levilactobacillus sp.]MCI1606544.1 hypothetical protein [Levilactobacillus sp.]TGD18688.1 AsnC family protein [Levilactobacillus suantsaiihabitans]